MTASVDTLSASLDVHNSEADIFRGAFYFLPFCPVAIGELEVLEGKSEPMAFSNSCLQPGAVRHICRGKRLDMRVH